MIITLKAEDYGNSVYELLKLAKGDTGGSRVAAQVLLSGYNGRNWQLSISELCNLDANYYQHALNVIHGRVRLMREPHECIENGNDHFQDLQETWSRLHVNERFKTTCYACNGTGDRYSTDYEEVVGKCYSCEGRGTQLPDGLEYREG